MNSLSSCSLPYFSLPFTTPPTPLDEQILMQYFYIPHDHWQRQRYTSSQLNLLSRHNTPPTHPPIYQHNLDCRQRSGTTLFRAPFSLSIWWRLPQCTGEKKEKNNRWRRRRMNLSEHEKKKRKETTTTTNASKIKHLSINTLRVSHLGWTLSINYMILLVQSFRDLLILLL